MKLTFVIPAMGSGGAERALSHLANKWAERGWKITILTFSSVETPSFYALHPSVKYQPLGISRGSSKSLLKTIKNLPDLGILRAAIRRSQPHAVVSLLERANVQTLVATSGMRFPVVVSEYGNPRMTPLGRFWETLRKITYPWAARLIVEVPQSLSFFSSGVQRNGTIIPNPVVLPDMDAEAIRASWDNGTRQKKVIAMGRLVHQKGFDYLLKAWAQVQAKHPDWTLEIWGESSDPQDNMRPMLEKMRDELGLTNRVQMPGVTSEPFAKMREASVFVLSSRHEGLPNALCEAMANGCACVSYDCPTGPSELIRNGYDGLLVPAEDVQALANTLDQLLSNPQLQRTLGQNAPEVLERFTLPSIIQMWEKVFEEVTRRKSLHAK